MPPGNSSPARGLSLGLLCPCSTRVGCPGRLLLVLMPAGVVAMVAPLWLGVCRFLGVARPPCVCVCLCVCVWPCLVLRHCRLRCSCVRPPRPQLAFVLQHCRSSHVAGVPGSPYCGFGQCWAFSVSLFLRRGRSRGASFHASRYSSSCCLSLDFAARLCGFA